MVKNKKKGFCKAIYKHEKDKIKELQRKKYQCLSCVCVWKKKEELANNPERLKECRDKIFYYKRKAQICEEKLGEWK